MSYGSQSSSSFAALYAKYVTEDVKVDHPPHPTPRKQKTENRKQKMCIYIHVKSICIYRCIYRYTCIDRYKNRSKKTKKKKDKC